MRPARDLDDRTGRAIGVGVELVVAGIAVGVQESGEASEMRLRSLAFAVGRIAEECRRRPRYLQSVQR